MRQLVTRKAVGGPYDGELMQVSADPTLNHFVFPVFIDEDGDLLPYNANQEHMVRTGEWKVGKVYYNLMGNGEIHFPQPKNLN